MKRSLSVLLILILPTLFAQVAHAQTQNISVSAHGTGVVPGYACDFGGGLPGCPNTAGVSKGIKFSFSFSGTGPGTSGDIPVSGTWSATEPDTGIKIEWATGFAFVRLFLHELQLDGTCIMTTPLTGESQLGACQLAAQDGAQNGRVDQIRFQVFADNGQFVASGELASGNISINAK